MIYNYKSYDKLLSIINDFNFKDIDLKLLAEKLKASNKIKKWQTYIDVRNGKIYTDEKDLEDNETQIPEYYDYQLIKFFENNPEFVIDNEVETLFFQVSSKIKQVPGIEYAHIHSMPNFRHPEHTDGNLVLMIHLSCPVNQNTEIYGLMIDNEVYQPAVGEITWLETKLIHSAWNFSNTDWRFLTISIDRLYID